MAVNDGRSWSFNDDGIVNNAQIGQGSIDGGRDTQSVYAESSTQYYPIGARRVFPDGREFRYASIAATTAAGNVVSQDVSATCKAVADDIVIAASGAFSPAAGSSKFQITLASISADDYAGGYLHTEDDAGEGHTYRIQSNSATGATTSGKVDIYLYDSIVVALSAGATDIAITGNLFKSVRPALGTADYIVCGVAPIAFTADYFGWIQTKGVATILSDGTPAIGQPVMLSDATAGSVEVADNSHPTVGFALHVGTSGGHVGVALQLP